MNDWSQLESRLRSWKPRRPSARIEARLFAPPDTAIGDMPAGPAWRWLAPAMAMGLLAMMMVSNSLPKSTYWGAAQPSNLLATAALSHPDWTGYFAGSYQSDHNTLSSTFEWTNDSRSLTSAAQFLNTNGSRP